MSYDSARVLNAAGGGAFTFASLPSAAQMVGFPPGISAYVSDVNPGLYVWTGIAWVSVSAAALIAAATGLNLPQGGNSGISNYTAQNTGRLRAAIARVKAGTGVAKIACIGDSTTMGAYSNGIVFAGNKPLAFPAQLATQLAAKGIAATNCSFFGTGNVAPATAAGYNAYNPAVSMTGGFAPGAIATLGAFAFASTTLGATLSYVPENSFAFDTVDIYYLGGTGGAFTVNVDGGATLATITPTGTHNVQVTTVTGIALATHTLNLVASAATGVFIVGVAARASGTKRIEVYDMGWSAVEVLNPANASISYAQPTSPTNQYNYFVGLPVVAPDLTIINLTINDIDNQPSSVAVYQAALQTMVTQALVSGDCVLMVGNPGNKANWTVNPAVAAAYQAAVYAVALASNVPVCDITLRWTSYAITNPVMAYGDAGANALHPGTVGNGDMATALLAFFN